MKSLLLFLFLIASSGCGGGGGSSTDTITDEINSSKAEPCFPGTNCATPR